MHPQFTTKDAEQFWSRVDASGDCWLWTGGRGSEGYGTFYWQGKTRLAHRLVYQILVGVIPPTMQIDHLCRVRYCVNPDHMQIVTHRENILRGVGPTAKASQVTHCPKGHPYDKANTRIRWQGWRACRACKRIADQHRYQ